MDRAILNIISILYLGLVLTLSLGISEHDEPKRIVGSAIRRWLKLIGVLFVLSILVHLISSL